jgi:hypothetical protein
MDPWLRFSISPVILFVCSVLCLYGQDGKEVDPVPKSDAGAVFLRVSISDGLTRTIHEGL